jgi:hypothetical protein
MRPRGDVTAWVRRRDMRLVATVCRAIAWLTCANSAAAAPGDLDPSFAGTGWARTLEVRAGAASFLPRRSGRCSRSPRSRGSGRRSTGRFIGRRGGPGERPAPRRDRTDRVVIGAIALVTAPHAAAVAPVGLVIVRVPVDVLAPPSFVPAARQGRARRGTLGRASFGTSTPRWSPKRAPNQPERAASHRHAATLKPRICRTFAGTISVPRLPENRGVPGSRPGLAIVR